MAQIRAFFTEEEQAEFVEEHGIMMRYYERTLCPCLAINKGIPDKNCDCLGGFRYSDPIDYKVQRGSINYRSLPTDIGMILQGGCRLTIPAKTVARDTEGDISDYPENPLYLRVARGDVFCEMNFSRRDGDILWRGTRDFLYSFDVEEILRVVDRTKEYAAHDDYTFDPETKRITFMSDKGPATGQPYTVEFLSKVQYVVWNDQAKHRGSDINPLARYVYCQLRQYVPLGTSSPVDNLSSLSEDIP